MSTMSATPIPMAPPDPPSPRIVAIMGTGRMENSFMLSAMAWLIPRSSPDTPG